MSNINKKILIKPYCTPNLINATFEYKFILDIFLSAYGNVTNQLGKTIDDIYE